MLEQRICARLWIWISRAFGCAKSFMGFPAAHDDDIDICVSSMHMCAERLGGENYFSIFIGWSAHGELISNLARICGYLCFWSRTLYTVSFLQGAPSKITIARMLCECYIWYGARQGAHRIWTGGSQSNHVLRLLYLVCLCVMRRLNIYLCALCASFFSFARRHWFVFRRNISRDAKMREHVMACCLRNHYEV